MEQKCDIFAGEKKVGDCRFACILMINNSIVIIIIIIIENSFAILYIKNKNKKIKNVI